MNGHLTRRTLLSSTATLAGAGLLARPAVAQAKTEVTFARFFGACEGNYGTSTDIATARGECGVMTTIVNQFNATNKDNIVVKPQIVEWGPYYEQLVARLAAKDIPTIAVMHSSQIGDYVRYVEPMEDLLKGAGIDPADFTPNARAAVTVGGKISAMPWDTHSWLWHVNVGLFKQAGLVGANGEPTIPRSVDELLAQATQVKERTGKPYFILATTGAADVPGGARGYYSWLYQQDGTFFPGGYDKANFRTPESLNAFGLFEKLARGGFLTRGIDTAGAMAQFIDGGGAVMMTGTWRIDDFVAAAAKPGTGLNAGGYTVRSWPNLFKHPAVWTDNHTWVLPRGGSNNPQVRKAALSFLRFMWDHNFDWARGGGHLPARQSLVAEYAQLPQRRYVVDIPAVGRALPHEVRRQFGFNAVIGEEIANIINTSKTADQAATAVQERSVALLRR